MRFFLDNCTSPRHANGLRAFAEQQKYDIIHLRDRFEPSTPDPEWIRALGVERDWIIISGDIRITKSPAEKKAWHESGLTAFFFAGLAEMQYWKQAAELVRWWPDLVIQASKTPSGHGFLIPKNAREMRRIYAV